MFNKPISGFLGRCFRRLSGAKEAQQNVKSSDESDTNSTWEAQPSGTKSYQRLLWFWSHFVLLLKSDLDIQQTHGFLKQLRLRQHNKMCPNSWQWLSQNWQEKVKYLKLLLSSNFPSTNRLLNAKYGQQKPPQKVETNLVKYLIRWLNQIWQLGLREIPYSQRPNSSLRCLKSFRTGQTLD
jgi:hypothetical protein